MTQDRTWQSKASERWPKAKWIAGDGPLAVVAECHDVSVNLWHDEVDAERDKRGIDARGCGVHCRNNHSIVRLDRST